MIFNEALEKATELCMEALSDLEEDIILVRDLHGRIRVLLNSANSENKSDRNAFKKALKKLSTSLSTNLKHYSYAQKDVLLFRDNLPNLGLPTADSATVLAKSDRHGVYLHDRLLTGTAWNAKPLDETKEPRRFTLFSMKGGVGRSTTTVVLAHHLAKKGKRVLVFDLDLESPGVGSTLLGPNLPRFGIVDWFVEDALGQGATVLPDLVVESPLGESTPGRIAVVPAFGTDTGDYMAKLGRVTLERGPNGPEPWAKRLNRFVEAVEKMEQPDVVLLDSRTGLHDSSASLVMAMGAHSLLFAIDTEQTWSAYRFLFQHWKTHPNLRDFRNKLWVVGAMIPDSHTSEYIEGLEESAWELFNYSLYEDAEAKSDADAFTFSLTDEFGNHYPRHVLWQRGLMAFDPLETLTDQLVTAAYQSFLDWFDEVLLEESQDENL